MGQALHWFPLPMVPLCDAAALGAIIATCSEDAVKIGLANLALKGGPSVSA